MKPRTPKPPISRPPSADPNSSPNSQHRSPEISRPLNVTDALSYLDAVKVQFEGNPEVYNQFLDIMKDFKSEVIDTPGVIQRVSRLFHGNPYLIKGFNTFLPLGYHIDISLDPLDPNTITVTTPMGTTTQTTSGVIHLTHSREVSTQPPTYPFPASSPMPLMPGGSGSRSMTPHAYQLTHGFPPPDQTMSPGYPNNSQTAAASVLNNLNNRNPVERQPQGEFNHAIHYLNKIKARYSDDSNVYKQFLDILQAYQKEQRHLHDSQVYIQVQHLFKDAPDLLAEFTDFMPDIWGNPGQAGVVILPQPSASNGPSTSWAPPESNITAVADKSKRSSGPSKRKKRPVEKDTTPVPPTKLASSRTKKSKHHHKADSGSSNFSPYMAPQSPPPIPSASQLHHGVLPPPQPMPPFAVPQGPPLFGGSTSADKLLFFDRAKKSLESREMYEEFLKLLSLFSKEIIDLKTLIERTRVFLGDGDLMTEFKDLVGWDERQENVENGPPGSIRTGPPEALSALPADDGEGPSYRRLPDSEIRLACSGRDSLCRSVLNDEWVSHPTWASEEAGFQAHKKNSFEEALHKSEEERHEYHVHIEALTRTISLLEPLCARIEDMTNEERSMFKLKPDFGGPGKSIYHRIIKKVYGRDGGLEIIQALQDCPSVALPVVLARLKQKDEEWRRAQREWSRTWREVDAKNFYKSLDQQGISFKANDKKNITAKHFVADIEAIKTHQASIWEQTERPPWARPSIGHQLEYSFHDTSVLIDSLKMVYSFLDRSHAQYSLQERRSIERFLRGFIPMLGLVPLAEYTAACGPLPAGNQDDESSHEPSALMDGSRSGRRSIGSTHSAQSNGVPAGDLRRKLMRTAQEKANRGPPPTSALGSRVASPIPDVQQSSSLSRAEDEKSKDVWITALGISATTQDMEAGAESERPFLANTTFYTLIRLLQLLYSRLLMCKEIGSRLAAEKHGTLFANKVAIELGLDDPNGPSAILKQTIGALGLGGSATDDMNVVYMYFLSACDKLFDGDLDQATFEEHMRWFFGNKAYQLFTLDKLLIALVKQVQTIVSDNKCQELWSLLSSAQSAEVVTKQDMVRYRREAERHVGQDEHLYRLQWVPELKCLRVYLIDTGDASIESDGTARSRWTEYMNTYVMNYPSEWVPATRTSGPPVFLRRNTRTVVDAGTCTASSWTEGRMRISVHPSRYKVLYESGTEDFLWQRRSGEEEKLLGERAKARHEERKRSRLIC